MTPERERCALIASAEYEYWKNAAGSEQNPQLLDIQIGSMAAAANICAAIFLGISPEEHAKSKLTGMLPRRSGENGE